MKRFSKDCGEGSSGKRAKLNGDDLWSDSDPDIDDVLLQASQNIEQFPPIVEQAEEAKEDDSILSFTSFNRNVAASTQLNNSVWAQPAAATSVFAKKCKEFNEVKQLKEQITSKEGEISVLRAQLKQTKEHAETVYASQINETLDRLKATQQERDLFSTKLEFKDLEIVNLRKKLTNISKNLFDGSTSNEAAGESKIVQDNFRGPDSYVAKVIDPVANIKYPLQCVIPIKIFESRENDKFPKVLHSKQLTDERYLHSLVCPNLQGEHDECHPVFTYIHYGKTLRLQHFFDEIRFLRDASESQLLQETEASTQIYLLTLTLLINQLNYLTTFAKSVKTDEIREHDLRNLQYPNKNVAFNISLMEPKTCDNCSEECAIQCRQCIALLASLYSHNRYLRNLISNSKLPHISEKERKTWIYPFSEIYSSDNIHRCYLKLLYQIVLYIGDTRRGNVYIGLLCSICYLLRQILQYSTNDDKLIDQVIKLLNAIILTTPSYPVLYYVGEVLKHGSTSVTFVQHLCRNCRSNIRKKVKKGIMLVNEKCCIIEMYFSMCREALEQHNTNKINEDFRMQLALVQFVTNALKCNVHWMHFDPDNTHFECQKEFYKLTIAVIHSSLLKYRLLQLDGDKIIVEVQRIVHIAPNILGILFAKYGELIEFDAQYNAMFKSSLMLLREMQGTFRDWNQFIDETVRHTTSESSPLSPAVFVNLFEETLVID